MATRALPSYLRDWETLLEAEAHHAWTPLPALGSVRIAEGGSPTVVLIDPDRIPGVTYLYVDVDGMPPSDRIALHGLLEAIARQAGIRGPLQSILNQGGLDYEFSGRDDTQPVRLRALPRYEEQLALWGLLHALVQLTARYVD